MNILTRFKASKCLTGNLLTISDFLLFRLLICLSPVDDFPPEDPEDNPEEPGEAPSVPSSGANFRFDCLKTFFGRLTYVVI